MKVDILAIGAHPDDVELSCSGTLLHYLARGKTVGLLDLTRGELGTRGTAELRDKEGAASAEKMGAAFRKNLGLADGFFAHTRPNIERIVQIIRWCQPEIVLANAVSDRHPDHGRGAKLAADACFYSGLIKIPTTDPTTGEIQERWRPQAIYHYIQDHNLEPDFLVDITPYIDQKMELVMTFRSQFYQPGTEEEDKELSTPISGKQFSDYLRARAAATGRIAGYDFAEGYICTRTPGVRDLFALD